MYSMGGTPLVTTKCILRKVLKYTCALNSDDSVGQFHEVNKPVSRLTAKTKYALSLVWIPVDAIFCEKKNYEMCIRRKESTVLPLDGLF